MYTNFNNNKQLEAQSKMSGMYQFVCMFYALARLAAWWRSACKNVCHLSPEVLFRNQWRNKTERGNSL